MITFKKKSDAKPIPSESEADRFEQVRNAALERRQKSDTDGTRRRDRQTAENHRLI
jgi:hypothetical protein